MRIAIISAHSCPLGTLGTRDTGGMSVYTVEVARELGKLGHTVDAYTRMHAASDPIEVPLGENARLIHIEAGPVAKIDKLAVYPLLPEFSRNLEAFRRQDDITYDLVFSHYWLSTWAGEYLSRWWDVPHVTMFHTLGAVKNSFTIGSPDPDLRISKEGELARHVYHTIVPTEREKAELVNQYNAPPERMGVVPCGVNLDLFSPVDRETARQELELADGNLILFVGRIDPIKGISNLIEAMPLLKADEKARLLVVGGERDASAETNHLHDLARDLGIADRIEFTGSVPQDMMPFYYSAADVCVVPSFYESFGLVALESLSCGTPVVANDVGDLKNIIRQGETGYVTETNAPAELAEKIDLVLGSCHAPASVIRESVRDFAWSNIAASLAEEFGRVIDHYHNPCLAHTTGCCRTR